MAIRNCLTVAVLVICLLLKDGYTFTESEINALRSDIRKWIDEASISELGEKQVLIPGLSRLSFHDCVGGCDGCINKGNPENAGLERYVDVIENFYQNNVTLDMTRADFWNLAAIEAMVYGSELGNMCRRCTPDPLPLVFRYGRVDCTTSDGTPYTDDEHVFPDATRSGTHAVDYFTQEFGMTARQTVAIMGAHTLGKAHKSASGFQNKWVENPNRVNNEYYITMMNESFGWEMVEIQRRRQASRFQWSNAVGEFMMLNTDMGLLLDLEGQIDTETGNVTGCDYFTCSVNSMTLADMAEFTFDNAAWLVAFADAFDKMTMNGYSSDDLFLPTV